MEQLDLLNYVLDLIESQQIPYMVVGSFASGVYGEPRFTNDIDIVINPQRNQLEALFAGFPEDEFYVSRDAARDALSAGTQFNVIHSETSNKIDFMIARRDAWGVEQIARRAKVRLLPNREGFAATAEDLILSKLLYYQEGGSEKHLRDIAGMLKNSLGKIDRQYLEKWVRELNVQEQWDAVSNRLGK